MTFIRWALGRIILLFNWLFTPRSRPLNPELKQRFDREAHSLALYQYLACPFCVKVRREIKRLNLDITTCDAKGDPVHKEQLEQQGGKLKVPCLRIKEDSGEVKWLYESSDIIHYLQHKFST